MSEQHLNRKHELVSKKHQNHSSTSRSTSNIAIAHRPSQASKLSATTPAMHCRAWESTKTLQEEKDCMPAITLTTYKHETPDRTAIPSMLHLIKPIGNDLSASSTTNYLANDSFFDDNKLATYSTSYAGQSIKPPLNTSTADLLALRIELETHFQALKSEFEIKTGRAWTPLRAWENEAWEWNDGGVEKEELFGWD
jgi:hypothetical protein